MIAQGPASVAPSMNSRLIGWSKSFRTGTSPDHGPNQQACKRLEPFADRRRRLGDDRLEAGLRAALMEVASLLKTMTRCR
jgi:hypothetical protein